MFEPIKSNANINQQGTDPIAGTPGNLASASVSPKQDPDEIQKTKDEEKTTVLEVAKPKEEESSKVNESFLSDLEQDMEVIHNVGLQFALHEDTGRTIVKVFNKDTDKLIREIPQEEVLNLAAKLDEMIGIIFDETV